MAASREEPLGLREQRVEHERETGGEHDPDEQHREVAGLQAREDVIAQRGLPDGRRERGGAHRPHGGGPDARGDDGRCERQLDLAHDLPR